MPRTTPITINGITYPSLAQMCRTLDINRVTLYSQMHQKQQSAEQIVQKIIENRDMLQNKNKHVQMTLPHNLSIRKVKQIEKENDLSFEEAVQHAKANKDTHRVPVTIDGIDYPSITHACRAYGVPPQRAIQRIQHGWDPQDAILKPPQKGHTGKPITINGVTYASKNDAIRELDLGCRQIDKILTGQTTLEEAQRRQANQHRWTEAEIEILKTYYPKEGQAVLDRLPDDISIRTLNTKTHDLGILRENRGQSKQKQNKEKS